MKNNSKNFNLKISSKTRFFKKILEKICGDNFEKFFYILEKIFSKFRKKSCEYFRIEFFRKKFENNFRKHFEKNILKKFRKEFFRKHFENKFLEKIFLKKFSKKIFWKIFDNICKKINQKL